MATYDASLNNGGRGFTLRLTVNQVSQSIAGNTSTVSWSLVLIKGTNSYSFYTKWWSVNIGGQTASGTISGYDFRNYSTLTLGSGSFVIPHNADGTKTISVSGSFDEGSNVLIGNGTASGSLALTTIPRATQPTVSPTSGNTASTYAIGHVAASTSFFHDLAYSVDGGATYTNIATSIVGTDPDSSWTPPHTLFPNSGTGTAIIRLITRQTAGGTIIGTNTVNLPLTVPASVKPTISAAAWSDAQTSSPDIPTLMGGAGRYVQLWSRLTPTLTSGGAGGSTVTSSQITQNGQQTSSGTAFTNAIALSGSVPFSATVTDSRGRSSDSFAGTVNVTAYNYPSLPTPLVVRTSDAAGNTPSPTGTYLAITPAASVSSLIFGGSQKNLLEWRIRIKQVGGAYTLVQDWTSTGVSGNVWTTKYVPASTYSASNEYIVEVSVRDLFGKNGFRTTQTVVTTEVPVASESVFMDWDGTNGVGLGKYRQNGALDVKGTIYQDRAGGDSRRVLDTLDIPSAASETVAGVAEIATNTEIDTGTDDLRIVTPAKLVRGLARSGGMRYVDTVYFTSSGTFSKASYPWLRGIRVLVQGAGGAGGGAAAPGAGNHNAGSGGGGGGCTEAFITGIAGLPTNVTVTVGAGGTAASGAAGNAGGDSSFNSTIIGSGGGGGLTTAASALATSATPGAGGEGSGGDATYAGSAGGMAGGNATLGIGGSGGGAHLGGGAVGAYTGAGSGGVTGAAGKNYGGGGGGGTANASATARSGGAGAPGIVIVELYA